MKLVFNIQLQRFGTMMDQFKVRAEPAGLVGVYHGGKPYVPKNSQVLRGLGYRYCRAFERSPIWWAFGLSDVLRCDLVRFDGKPMGSLFATFEGECAQELAQELEAKQ